MIIDIIRISNGLVFKRDTFPGGPVAFFSQPSETTFIAKNIVYLFQTLLGDGVLVRPKYDRPVCLYSTRRRSIVAMSYGSRGSSSRSPLSCGSGLAVSSPQLLTRMPPYAHRSSQSYLLLQSTLARRFLQERVRSSSPASGNGLQHSTHRRWRRTSWYLVCVRVHRIREGLLTFLLRSASGIQDLGYESTCCSHERGLTLSCRSRHRRRGTSIFCSLDCRPGMLCAEVERTVHHPRHRTFTMSPNHPHPLVPAHLCSQ